MPSRVFVLHGLAVFSAYFATAELGLRVASYASMVTVAWPPAGVALAALLAWGSGMVPFIWAAALLVNVLQSIGAGEGLTGALLVASPIALTNTLAPVVARSLLHPGHGIRLNTFTDIARLYGASGAAALISAVGGTAALVVHGLVGPTDIAGVAITWWLGDALGLVIVAPLLLGLRRDVKWDKAALPLATSLFVAVMLDIDPLGLHRYVDVAWMTLLPLCWLAVRAGPSAVPAGFSAVAMVLWLATSFNLGPLNAREVADPRFAVSAWLAAGAFTAYGAGAFARQLRDALYQARQSGRHFLRLIEHFPTGAVFIDDGGVVVLNPAAAALAGDGGTGGADVATWSAQAFVDPSEFADLRRRVRAAWTHHEPCELAVRHQDGTVRSVAMVGVRVHGGDVWLMHDVTEWRAREEELRRARDDAEAGRRARGEFLGVMSHEIRTPLNGVIGVAELLRDSPLDDRQRLLLDTLGHSAEQLLSLLNSVLELVRLDAGRFEPRWANMDPRQPAIDVVRTLESSASQRGLSLDVVASPDLPDTVCSDVMCVRQVLMNLVGNAVKFTGRGGVRVEVRVADGQLRYDVIDTGIGMDRATMARIFEPFVQGDATSTRRYEGTGLGLAISRRFATALGGTLTAISEPAAGSTFTLRLPINPSERRPRS